MEKQNSKPYLLIHLFIYLQNVCVWLCTGQKRKTLADCLQLTQQSHLVANENFKSKVMNGKKTFSGDLRYKSSVLRLRLFMSLMKRRAIPLFAFNSPTHLSISISMHKYLCLTKTALY